MANKLLEYVTCKDNILYWVKKPSKCILIGSKVGNISSGGYIEFSLKGQRYYAHRVIWELYYGTPPLGSIDHIDGNRSNNSIANLREATAQQNTWNTFSHKDAKSQYKGVSFEKGPGKWRARCYVQGKNIHLGLFNDEISAARAYDIKALDIFGDYAKLNFQGMVDNNE